MKKRISRLVLRSVASALLLVTLMLETGAAPPPPPGPWCNNVRNAGLANCISQNLNWSTNQSQCIALAHCVYAVDVCYCECNYLHSRELQELCAHDAYLKRGRQIHACQFDIQFP